MKFPHPPIQKLRRAFTLLEMLVATTILVIVMGVIMTAIDFTVDSWRRTTGSITAFENARVAFTQFNELLSQATLNTYADYYDANRDEYRTAANSNDFVPTTFKRQSELHYLSGPSAGNTTEGTPLLVLGANAETHPGHAVFFQAPLGRTNDDQYRPVNGLLNSVGFYVEYGDRSANLPQFIQDLKGGAADAEWRFRLMQWIRPTEDFKVYDSTNVGNVTYNLDWLPDPANPDDQDDMVVLAENIVLLLLLPKLDEANEILVGEDVSPGFTAADADGSNLAPNFYYDSRGWDDSSYPSTSDGFGAEIVELTRNQMPPLIEVIMVAIDEPSAQRLSKQYGSSVPDELKLEADGEELFVLAQDLERDLEDYENKLGKAGVNFRTFRNTVNVNTAKWSP